MPNGAKSGTTGNMVETSARMATALSFNWNAVSIKFGTLYRQLGELITTTPEPGGRERITPNTNRWLGRSACLVQCTGQFADKTAMAVAKYNLTREVLRSAYAQRISAAVYRRFARTETNAPAASRQAQQ